MLLAIDTATARASIALHDGHTVREECTWEASNRHTVTLVPHIVHSLEALELEVADLTAIAVCIGPGSYTGVRIGVSFAKGMALTRLIPLVGITTLDILVSAQPAAPHPLYATFAAGRKRIGYARYRWQDSGWQAETDVAIATWADMAEHITEPSLVMGEISPLGQNVLHKIENVIMPQPARHLRRAGFLADLGWKRIHAGQLDDPGMLMPLYTR